jgi:hypothetical protein
MEGRVQHGDSLRKGKHADALAHARLPGHEEALAWGEVLGVPMEHDPGAPGRGRHDGR